MSADKRSGHIKFKICENQRSSAVNRIRTVILAVCFLCRFEFEIIGFRPDGFESRSSGPGPTAGFISLISVKETNQRKRSPAAGFSDAVYLTPVQRHCRGNRLQAIAMRLRGGCGRDAVEAAG